MNQPVAGTPEKNKEDKKSNPQGMLFEVRYTVSSMASMLTSMQEQLEQAATRVEIELASMIGFINASKSEIDSINIAPISRHDIPDATVELKTAIDETENAANQIMDVADELFKLRAICPPEIAGRIDAIYSRILEATNFQDITGQRINKVIRVLQHVENKLGQVAHALGSWNEDFESRQEGQEEAQSEADELDEDSLLNGPALDGKGASQQEIDSLLGGF